MINLLYIACCKTDLVAVGAVAVSCPAHKLLLRKLTLQGLTYRNGRVAGTCNSHSLIYIGSSRERVTDRTAKTGCGTTERLYLCRMVMCLILKVDKPLLCYSVYCDRNHDAAGIDLIGYFHILESALLL